MGHNGIIWHALAIQYQHFPFYCFGILIIGWIPGRLATAEATGDPNKYTNKQNALTNNVKVDIYL